MARLENGSRGDSVQKLQEKLSQLGFRVVTDGLFGQATEELVRRLQSAFGYRIDGIVGQLTLSLIDVQIACGWNALASDAGERALRAQGKDADADALAGRRLAGWSHEVAAQTAR